MITMTEIARLTGVSQPTVSRVLNGNKAVSPEIRERVLACAREHNFQPNVMAQSLVGSRTHLIGVILTDISNSFFADLAKYLEQAAREEGYSLILFNSNYDADHEKECLDIVRRYRVDGLIVVPVDEHSAKWKENVRQLDIPVIVITRRAEGIDSFYLDHQEAGGQVADHLYREGYRDFIFCGNTADAKYKGFEAVLDRLLPDLQNHLTVVASKDRAEVLEQFRKYFEGCPGKTGIFAYNDRRAVQAMGILQQIGIRIPEQAGIVGFDDTYMCEYIYPKLSSVAQPIGEMAVRSVRRLLYKLEHPEDETMEDFPMKAELITRSSSQDRKGQ